MSAYSFVKLEPQRLQDVNHLYNIVFKNNLSSREINHLFDTTLFGKYTIGFLAYSSKGEIAGYYGVFPIRVVIDGEIKLAAQSGATMTHPNHQKKGLFIELATRTFQESKLQGIEFIYGFPNENSLPGFQRKLNWEFHGHIQKFTIKNNVLPICEIASKSNFAQRIYQSAVSIKLRKYQIVEFNPKSPHQNSVYKDSNFLHYKLQNKGNYLIEINGFQLLIKTTPHLLIADVSTFDKSQLPIFLSTIQLLAKKIGARKTILQVSPNHWLALLLASNLSLSQGLPIGFLQLNGTHQLENFQFTFADFDTF